MLSKGDPVDCEIYAEKVARGYRVPIPSRWPEPVRELVASCWAQEPEDRPSMDDVARMIVSWRRRGGRERKKNGGGELGAFFLLFSPPFFLHAHFSSLSSLVQAHLRDAGCFEQWDVARLQAIKDAGCWACCGVM